MIIRLLGVSEAAPWVSYTRGAALLVPLRAWAGAGLWLKFRTRGGGFVGLVMEWVEKDTVDAFRLI